MPSSPEKSGADDHQHEFTHDEALDITRKWYGHTSFEGRTKAEFDALRDQMRNASSIDFARRGADRDYRRLVYENPFVNEFLAESTITDLWIIYEKKAAIGLSDAQFEKLVAAFGSEIEKRWSEEVANDNLLTGAIKEGFTQFTPEEIRQHGHDTTATMEEEIGLQEKGMPHEMRKPSLFPPKKRPT